MELTMVGSEIPYPLMKKNSHWLIAVQKELRDWQINTFFNSKPVEESVILNVQYTG